MKCWSTIKKKNEWWFKLFTTKHPEAPAVYGQKGAQIELTQSLKAFEEEGINNKFLLLVGYNGSAKSSFVKKIMQGLEDFSATDEGSIYSFSWIFPIDNYTKGSLGFQRDATSSDPISTFAFLDDKEISAILPSELKDNPLLLIPKQYRQEIIEKHLGVIQKD